MSSGIHFLSARPVISQLLRSANLGEGDLVIDFGAGPGILTAPLAATGSRVLAVERDDAFVRRLNRRFADRPHVKVIHADLRTVPLPRQDFSVVSNIPYSLSTLLIRRLLASRSLVGADLIVEWGFARRITAARTKETLGWARKFHLRIARRVPASCFRPSPRVDSAHLVIRRR